MANQFSKEEVILFENVLERFESDNTVAKKASKFSQPGQQMQRRADTVWRPMPQISTTVPGLDVSGSIGSVTQRSVPAVLDTIESVPWEFDALEARDSSYRDEKARSAAQALSAVVNRKIADLVARTGTLVVTQPGALTGIDDISLVEAAYLEQDISDADSKCMVLNARDYNGMSANLAKANREARVEAAIANSALGRHAGFETFRTGYMARTAAAGASGVTVSGADQRHIPKSLDDVDDNVLNADNRGMNLTVSATANIAVGDAFTIAGVNALSHINKNDTGQLKTFRVVEVVDGTTLKIYPAIVDGSHGGATDAEEDYANVSATPANSAAITFLNTQAAGTNIHFCENSIEVFGGRLAFNEDMAGVSVMRQATDSGIEIVFAKQGNAKTGKAFYRLTLFFGVTNKNPEMNGILLGGQS